MLENLDEDYSARDLAPIAVRSHADGMFIDLVNGPRSIGICAGYSCNFRLGNYFSIMALRMYYSLIWAYHIGQLSKSILSNISYLKRMSDMLHHKLNH